MEFEIKRYIKWFFQRITRGFDDRETWELFYTIAKFLIPRLKRFKEVNNGYPNRLTEQQWDEILDKMIEAFQLSIKEFENGDFIDKEEEEKIEHGLQLFSRYFLHLWW